MSEKDGKLLKSESITDFVVVEHMEDDSKKQIELWSNKFGDDYVLRNEITDENFDTRVAMWRAILSSYGLSDGNHVKSALEIGCGQGINLMALREIHNKIDKPIELYGVETNQKACFAASENLAGSGAVLYNVDWLDTEDPDKFDLVFTSGVLIHVHKDNLLKFMKKMYQASSKYIVCIEYFSAERREINYRGQSNALWTDDYGAMWLDNFKLRCVTWGFMWKRMTGLDNLTYWVFEKPQ